MTAIKFFFLALAILLFSCCSEQKNKSVFDHDNLFKQNDSNTNIIAEQKWLNPDDDSKVQKMKVLCECFLLDSARIEIYDAFQGNVIDTIQNDYKREIIYSIFVYKQVSDWFYVDAKAIMGEEVSGWIKNKSYFGTYSRNYIDTLKIYAKPDTSSNIECVFPEYFSFPMKVIECKDNWTKLEIIEDNKTCIGWVLQYHTCPNPYSTCP